MAKRATAGVMVQLEGGEREALGGALRGDGRPVGTWIGERYGLSPATVLGAALGMPLRLSTAMQLRASMAHAEANEAAK